MADLTVEMHISGRGYGDLEGWTIEVVASGIETSVVDPVLGYVTPAR